MKMSMPIDEAWEKTKDLMISEGYNCIKRVLRNGDFVEIEFGKEESENAMV